MGKSTSSTKESRLSIRVDAKRKAVIARAAKQHGETISDFVLEHAYQMATELLADEEGISLSRKQIAHIFEALVTRDAAQGKLIDDLLSLFGGRTQRVMAHLVESGKLTMDDLKETEELLRKFSERNKSQ